MKKPPKKKKGLTIVRRPLPGNILEIFELISLTAAESVADQTIGTVTSADHMNRFFARLATGLWRVRQKMFKPGTNEPIDEIRIAFRHLDATWDLLSKEGIEVKDFTNQPFNPGMMLNVISREPTPGLKREMIVETIKPTVFYKGEPIQIGDVVIGTPKGER